ncbi:hypothetical protein BGM21_10185 [Geobacillus thermoleovorans]|nr:hypothetical protein BGM21_10185 [Geobacillus thermoleovorans]
MQEHFLSFLLAFFRSFLLICPFNRHSNSGRQDSSWKTGDPLIRSLAFIGGFSIIFVLMGATASVIGQMLVQYLDEKGGVSRQYQAQAFRQAISLIRKGSYGKNDWTDEL